MLLVDDDRRVVDVNGAYLQLLGYRRAEVVGRPLHEFAAGGPLMTRKEWAEALARRRFSGEAELVGAAGVTVGVQWGATTEIVTGRMLVLVVALSVSGRGRGLRVVRTPDTANVALSCPGARVTRVA